MNDLLQRPQTSTKRRKVSAEPIVDCSQSQILTSNLHVEAWESIVEKKHAILEERREKAKERELGRKQKEIAKETKARQKDVSRIAKAKQNRGRDL